VAEFRVQIIRKDTDEYTELPDTHPTLSLAADRCESINRRWPDLDPQSRWFDHATVRRTP
jgi:hypothetical protein